MTDPHTSRLQERLGEIGQLDDAALRIGWASLFGRAPPATLSRRLLELAAAYQAQARVYGALKPTVRRKLLAIGSSRAMHKARNRKETQLPQPGSRLVREWHGRVHTVDVIDGGFVYAGNQYRSLSQVACTITGARWSGPRFFGL